MIGELNPDRNLSIKNPPMPTETTEDMNGGYQWRSNLGTSGLGQRVSHGMQLRQVITKIN